MLEARRARPFDSPGGVGFGGPGARGNTHGGSGGGSSYLGIPVNAFTEPGVRTGHGHAVLTPL
ncbi:hypothetical protein SAMN02745121_05665 [Nannocystis exedens]|uniref:Uncharacterized protein n=1 Tax=Nannocystis exedens TaxID=54 RepID=A0A1I2DRC5_9BACT|nr:hypothetical protein [Nannocystis exedens]PCC69002.1 hypothetical protein NAEX_02024 [Nannocystis exedens]SFE82460.1 hypothetical protein SAMN02745121_05665 [Nannocystis exedens]